MEDIALETPEQTRAAAEKVRKHVAVDTEASFSALDAYLEKINRGDLVKVILEFDGNQDKKELNKKYPSQLRARVILLAIEEWERDHRC